MGRTISRIIEGEPLAQKRHRHASFSGKTHTYDPSKAAKKHFLAQVLEQGPIPMLEGPLGMTCVFSFERPKSHVLKSGRLAKGAPEDKTSKPDLDNLAKFVKDALNGTAYRDDSQIIVLYVTKQYGRARTDLTIQEL